MERRFDDCSGEWQRCGRGVSTKARRDDQRSRSPHDSRTRQEICWNWTGMGSKHQSHEVVVDDAEGKECRQNSEHLNSGAERTRLLYSQMRRWHASKRSMSLQLLHVHLSCPLRLLNAVRVALRSGSAENGQGFDVQRLTDRATSAICTTINRDFSIAPFIRLSCRCLQSGSMIP